MIPWWQVCVASLGGLVYAACILAGMVSKDDKAAGISITKKGE